jgi:hypothetical protein
VWKCARTTSTIVRVMCGSVQGLIISLPLSGWCVVVCKDNLYHCQGDVWKCTGTDHTSTIVRAVCVSVQGLIEHTSTIVRVVCGSVQGLIIPLPLSGWCVEVCKDNLYHCQGDVWKCSGTDNSSTIVRVVCGSVQGQPLPLSG